MFLKVNFLISTGLAISFSSSLVVSLSLKFPSSFLFSSFSCFDEFVLWLYLCSFNVERTLEADGPQYDTCRSLLRSGPAASLRVNIRAVSSTFLKYLFLFELHVLFFWNCDEFFLICL